ncbi:MAG: hypothetical protein U0556_09410 [Dehalococcoidia bacterium]
MRASVDPAGGQVALTVAQRGVDQILGARLLVADLNGGTVRTRLTDQADLRGRRSAWSPDGGGRLSSFGRRGRCGSR